MGCIVGCVEAWFGRTQSRKTEGGYHNVHRHARTLYTRLVRPTPAESRRIVCGPQPLSLEELLRKKKEQQEQEAKVGPGSCAVFCDLAQAVLSAMQQQLQ